MRFFYPWFFGAWRLLVGISLPVLGALVGTFAPAEVAAQQFAPRSGKSAFFSPVALPDAGSRSVGEWLLRIHEASRRRTYVGTYVVSAQGNLASAKIWYVCDGTQQMERVESLTGTPRSTFRLNDQVITFLPATKVARSENRSSLGLFPNLLLSADSKVDDYYSASRTGQERIAGVDAEIVQLSPKDHWRFGYRVWTEVSTGLVVKLQTMDASGQVLEQVAFSELQLDAPVKMEQLSLMMANTEGYRVEKIDPVKTSAQAEGWALRRTVDGFAPLGCFRRPAAARPGGASINTVQWIFSDGLASVSLFLEPFDRLRHVRENSAAAGATRMLSRRIQDWWVTAVGEVPEQTLQAFSENLMRIK